MKITRHTTFGQLLRDAAAVNRTPEISERMQELPKPAKVGRQTVPDSLDGLTLGELAELQDIPEDEVFTRPARVLLGLTPRQLEKCRAAEVIGFGVWVAREVKRISGMFAAIPSSISAEEKRAGLDKLNFGIFGMADAYARRMGIADQEYVLACVPWLRVWQCMMNDAKTEACQRRLREIYSEKNR